MALPPARRLLRGLLPTLGLALALPAAAAASKALLAPGYRLVQLTDSNVNERLPRVSHGRRAPNLVWISDGQLPDALSTSGDAEVFLWDGHALAQLTDDDIDDNRPVVNVRRQVAWQKWGQTVSSEIYERWYDPDEGWRSLRITVDESPVKDRYPDINDDGLVVWCRQVGFWHLSTHRVGSGDPWTFWADRPLYRPHVNNRWRIAAGTEWLREIDRDQTQLTLIQEWFPEDYGYVELGRSELNGNDQITIEAWPQKGPGIGDKTGPRDQLLWDGEQMRVLLSSPVWVGRGDLNDDGVVVFEGYGGLPGSTSGTDDREIYVYTLATDSLVQLTDDGVEDRWATVSDDGTVVWQGQGGVAGSTSLDHDTEIMLAMPLGGDWDADGVENEHDVCPATYDVLQADTDGDGVGDACEGSCAGFAGVADCSGTILAEPPPAPPPPPGDGPSCGLGMELALALVPLGRMLGRLRAGSRLGAASGAGRPVRGGADARAAQGSPLTQ